MKKLFLTILPLSAFLLASCKAPQAEPTLKAALDGKFLIG